MKVKEYFARLPELDAVEALDLVSFGQYPKMAPFEHWRELLVHCQLAVNILGENTFCGAATCALIMNMAMKALKREQGVNAPAPWLPVIRQLHAMAATAKAESNSQFEQYRPEWDFSQSALEFFTMVREQSGIPIDLSVAWLAVAPRLCGWDEGWKYLSTVPDLPADWLKALDWLKHKG